MSTTGKLPECAVRSLCCKRQSSEPAGVRKLICNKSTIAYWLEKQPSIIRGRKCGQPLLIRVLPTCERSAEDEVERKIANNQYYFILINNNFLLFALLLLMLI